MNNTAAPSSINSFLTLLPDLDSRLLGWLLFGLVTLLIFRQKLPYFSRVIHLLSNFGISMPGRYTVVLYLIDFCVQSSVAFQQKSGFKKAHYDGLLRNSAKTVTALQGYVLNMG